MCIFFSTHFKQCFTYENVWKTPMEEWHFYLKCHCSTGLLTHFDGKNQLPDLSVSETVQNGLNISFNILMTACFLIILCTFI